MRSPDPSRISRRFRSTNSRSEDGKKVKHVFQVWLADNPRRKSQGLMFVRDLPDLRGMLFVHEQPKRSACG